MTRRWIYSLEQRGQLLFIRAAISSTDGRSTIIRLLVDTGSNYTVLPPELLTELGCNLQNPVRQVTITSASGLIQAPVVSSLWFSCLGQRVERFPLIAFKLPPSAGVDGLLGIDFLRQCNAVIDVSKNQIWIDSD